MDDRIPRAFAVAVAILLLVGSGALFPQAGETKYPHTVDEVPADEVPDEATVIDYESLSPEGKRVIDEGAASADGDVTLYGEGPEQFEYTDTSGLGEDVFYVRQESTYYRVETYTGGLDTRSSFRRSSAASWSSSPSPARPSTTSGRRRTPSGSDSPHCRCSGSASTGSCSLERSVASSGWRCS